MSVRGYGGVASGHVERRPRQHHDELAEVGDDRVARVVAAGLDRSVVEVPGDVRQRLPVQLTAQLRQLTLCQRPPRRAAALADTVVIPRDRVLLSLASLRGRLIEYQLRLG